MIAVSIRWAQYHYFTILAEMEKRFSTTAIAKGAVNIRAYKDLVEVNVGYSSAGNTLCVGIRYNNSYFSLDVGMNYHNSLGVSSGVAIAVSGDRFITDDSILDDKK